MPGQARPDELFHATQASPARGARWRALRALPLAAGAAALATGFWGGFLRLGWELPGASYSPAELHGALMISGFFGTLISLERAVAHGTPAAYAAPAVAAIGAAALLAGEAQAGAPALMLASGLMVAGSIVLIRRLPALFTVLLAVASAAWLAGNVSWALGRPMAEATGWWLAFLVLTITAERVELSGLLQLSRFSLAIVVAAAALIIAGAVRGEFAGDAAAFTAAGYLIATAWLVRNDLARRLVRSGGRIRFTAVCILSGYVWLGVAGLVLLLAPPVTTAFGYDAAVHAVAIGFVLCMVFGHAPIIFPAITGIRLGFSNALYAPLALLHLSLATRIAGDLLAWIELRKGSAVLTVLAMASYAVVLVVVTVRGRG